MLLAQNVKAQVLTPRQIPAKSSHLALEPLIKAQVKIYVSLETLH